MGPAWTPAEIRSDVAKDNTVRLFVQIFGSEMLNLYNDNALTLSYIDSLSSGIFQTSLMGLYQAAPCIGP
jgi:hypothetical protein